MPSHDRDRAAQQARNDARRAERAREAQRRAELAHQAALRAAEQGGYAVDFEALHQGGSVMWPDFMRRGYYVDVPFTCRTCGSEEVWTARQQKWWYEVAKGSRDSGPGGCRPCRRQARATRLAEQDPKPVDPYKTPGRVLAAAEAARGPDLRAAGFRRVRARGNRPRHLRWAEFERAGGDLLVVIFDRRHHRLTAERMAANGDDLIALAAVDFTWGLARDAIEARLAAFVAPLRAALAERSPPA